MKTEIKNNTENLSALEENIFNEIDLINQKPQILEKVYDQFIFRIN